MRRRPVLVPLALLSGALPMLASATTWAPEEVPDPIAQGHNCQVSEPASYGSYIYQWPSKYDQVFWPYTDPHGIWFCSHSGYTSFMPGFDKLTDAEKARITSFLAEHYEQGKVSSTEQRLTLLEQIYALRDLDAADRNHLTRVLAYWYEERDVEVATKYRHAALDGIRTALRGELPEGQRLEYLYVAANYEREFGDSEQSDEDLAALRDAIDHLKDQKLEDFAEYLTELAKETPSIAPGKLLAPERPPEK